MIHIFITGILLGLTLSLMLGPSFFSLLHTSIDKGFKVGMFMAFGIFLSDFTLVALSYFGVSQLITEPKYQLPLGFISGGILIFYGIYTFRKKTDFSKVDEEEKKPKIRLHSVILTYMTKGYFLNLANPFLLIFWMSMMAYISSNYGTKSIEIGSFFAGTLITVLSVDLTKCFVANKIKNYLKPKLLSFSNHVVGIVLICCGIYIIFKTIYELYPSNL